MSGAIREPSTQMRVSQIEEAMGPTILFDKSAIQGLGQQALAEVGRYFFTVVPHVLLMETLADLSLRADDISAAQAEVAKIANKVFPTDSIANVHYHTMCVQNLLGDQVPMTRRPAVSGARPVVASDGSKGLVIDVQSETDAVRRWQCENFNSDDMRFAIEWRKAAKGTNLEEMKKVLPSQPVQLKTGEHVRDYVDLLLAQQEAQGPLLVWFINLMMVDAALRQRIFVRWRFDDSKMLATFAPYAFHCLRVQLIFYTGMLQGIFGTRSSNVVDLEYLYYSPFASVFCSGDKLHRQLAPLILAEDQTFVSSGDFQRAVNMLAAARESNPLANPEGESLIQQLWLKYCQRAPIFERRQSISEEENTAIMEHVRPIMEALAKMDPDSEPRKRFPV